MKIPQLVHDITVAAGTNNLYKYNKGAWVRRLWRSLTLTQLAVLPLSPVPRTYWRTCQFCYHGGSAASPVTKHREALIRPKWRNPEILIFSDFCGNILVQCNDRLLLLLIAYGLLNKNWSVPRVLNKLFERLTTKCISPLFCEHWYIFLMPMLDTFNMIRNHFLKVIDVKWYASVISTKVGLAVVQ